MAGTALAGSALTALVPSAVPNLLPAVAPVVASVVAAIPFTFLGSDAARADDVGGSGGLGPSRNNGFSLGGAGGTAAHPAGYVGTSGDRYNRSGGGGGGGAIGGLGGAGGAAYNGAAGGAGGATAGAAGGLGSQGSEAGGGGGGGAGGANPNSVVTLTNLGALLGQAGGAGGNGMFGTGFLNSAGGGGGGGAGAYAAIVTGGGISKNFATITGGMGGVGGNGGSGGSTNNGGQAGNGGGGGIGVQFTSSATGATFSSYGALAGGAGGAGGYGGYRFGRGNGGAGGIGLQLNAAGMTVNAFASVKGGQGGDGYVAGAGAIAAQFNAVGTLNNSSTVQGGVGGNGIGGGSTGGAGAAAVTMLSGGTINNNGLISGGTGGTGTTPGLGGIAVIGAGITISNTGTVSGGFANGGAGAQAYAIQFAGGTNAVGGTGGITGGINVAGGSFMPAVPGSTVGTPLAITGPLTFAAGTSYNIRVTPTATDSTNVTGGATLNGASVNVLAGSGTYSAGRYTILTASTGVTGTFSGVSSNLAFVTPSLSYDANDVYLTLTQGSFTTAAATPNQFAIASALNNAMKLNGSSPIFGALDQLTTAQAQAAFNSLTGDGLTAAQGAANRSAQAFGGAIFDQTTFYSGGGTPNQVTLTASTPGAGFIALAPRAVAPGDTLSAAALGLPVRELADLPRAYIAPVAVEPTRTWRAWGSGFGGQEDVRSNAVLGFAGQSNQIYGGAVGIDYQVTPNYLMGVAIGGSDGEFNVPNRQTFGSTTGGHIAFYDVARFGAFYAASSTSASFYQNRTTRNVAGFGGLASETEKGSFASREFRSRLEAGRAFGNLLGLGETITPFVALEIADLRSNGFGEQTIAGGPGGGVGLFALNVSGQSAADVPSFVGARFTMAVPLGNNVVFRPTIQAAWVHEFAPNRSQIAAIASLPGSTFLADGARPGRDAAQVKAGGELAIGPRTALFANFEGEFSGASQLYGGKGGVKIAF